MKGALMQPAVMRAITSMRERYHDPITMHEIASEVFVSPFHFSRIFARDTGVTPGRFLTAIRLFEAKRLLLTTSMTVSDIVCNVGYSSVGTFTTRFSRLVGMTPTQYREPEVGALLVAVAPEYHRLPTPAELTEADRLRPPVRAVTGGSVVATVHLPPEAAVANVVVGAFDSGIPQNAPVAYAATPNSGSTELMLGDVPAGEWTILAAAEPVNGYPNAGPMYLATPRRPVPVTTGRVTRIALRMRPVSSLDPPIAVTLASAAALGGMRGRAARRPALRAAA
jgi:AraC family transcriptional regulator